MKKIKIYSGWLFSIGVAITMYVSRSSRENIGILLNSDSNNVEKTVSKNYKSSVPKSIDSGVRSSIRSAKKSKSGALVNTDLKSDSNLPFEWNDVFEAEISDKLGDSAVQILLPYILDSSVDISIRRKAYYSARLSLLAMQDSDKALNMAFDFARTANSIEDLFSDNYLLQNNSCLISGILENKYKDKDSGKLSPDGYEKKIRKLVELANSDDVYIARIGAAAYEDIVGEPLLSDPDAVDRAIQDMRTLSDLADNAFPDNQKVRDKYFELGKMLMKEAKWRYGDTPKASEWLLNELEFARRKESP